MANLVTDLARLLLGDHNGCSVHFQITSGLKLSQEVPYNFSAQQRDTIIGMKMGFTAKDIENVCFTN
jgi:hypothetical protein